MEPTIPKLLRKIAGEYPNLPAQMHKDEKEVFQTTTFSEFHDQVRQFAAGLKSHGVKRGDRVGLISDNRREWFVSDIALQCLGAADVPRGCDSNSDEISYILGHAECALTLLENERQLEKVLQKEKDLPLLKEIIILDPDFDPASAESGRFTPLPFRGCDGPGEPIPIYPRLMRKWTRARAMTSSPSSIPREPPVNRKA